MITYIFKEFQLERVICSELKIRKKPKMSEGLEIDAAFLTVVGRIY